MDSTVGGARRATRAVSGGAIPPEAVRRVLVRWPNWLGDTIMALPTLRALRAALASAELWCAGPWISTVLETEPGIDRRLDYPARWPARWALAGELRRIGFDLALLLPNSFESAFLAWRSGARWRVGYARDGRSRLLTHALAPPATRLHQVDEYLGLLAPLGIAAAPGRPSLRVAESRQAEARRLLASVGWRAGDRAVGLQLGAAFGPSKLWPAHRLAALATRLERDGTPAVFLGDGSATPLLRSVEAAMATGARSLVGRDHPAVLPAILAELAVLVTPDTGPAHVAAAVGIPVVVLFGPTDPQRSAPVGDRHAVLWRPPPCAPCLRPECPIDHRCLTALTVENVATAVRERLAQPALKPGPP